jgi:hypothetical protein
MCPHFMRPVARLLLVSGLVGGVSPAWAERPLVTDAAEVVGARAIQIETWSHLDRNSLQHWLLAGFGPLSMLEVTVGAVHGLSRTADGGYSVAAPLVAAKLLLREPQMAGWPGLAVAGGAFAPSGWGDFRVPGWEYAAYGALTEMPFRDERLAIHVNGGFFHSRGSSADLASFTWAVAAQGRIHGDLFGAAEVFSGDPYLGQDQGAGQASLRFSVSPAFQLDATVGAGLWGARSLPLWGTLGLRLVVQSVW